MPISEPVGGHFFQVDLGDGQPAAFTTVVLPELAAQGGSQGPLLLRRALTDARDLENWWNQARTDPKAATRTATVTLVTAEGATVRRWLFKGARPLSLAYSPLDASQSNLVYEMLTLSFERVEIE